MLQVLCRLPVRNGKNELITEKSDVGFASITRVPADDCVLIDSGFAVVRCGGADGDASGRAQGRVRRAGAAVNPPGQPEYTAPLQQETEPHAVLGIWKPYAPHGLPQPVLKNSDRLHALIRDHKLLLSLNDAVALALENNFDIAIARYNLDIANTDLLLARSGGTVRGVSTGLLEGTPGGTAASTSTAGSTGGGSGGTSVGAGGSASGSGGLVISTQNSVGSPIDSFDPVLTGNVSWDRQLMPIPTPVIYGGNTALRENTNQYNFSYTQGWVTGTQAQVSYDNERLSLPTSIPAEFFPFNPEMNSSWKVQVRQHLLQGWGLDNNRRQILIAKNDIKVTDASFRAQVISTVAQIQNIYWDLVNAYENVKVQQTALEFANRTLTDNKKQVADWDAGSDRGGVGPVFGGDGDTEPDYRADQPAVWSS